MVGIWKMMHLQNKSRHFGSNYSSLLIARDKSIFETLELSQKAT